MSKTIDMTGQTIGDWLVLERAENTPSGKARWKCKCLLCGTEKVVTGVNLRAGQSKSCGCQKMAKMRAASMKNEEGNTYGYLHVLREATPEEKAQKDQTTRQEGVFWICECLRCGNSYVIVRGDYLRNGDTRSCGCLVSYNESRIGQYLNELKFNYKEQYHFDDLTPTGRSCDRLAFDFGILDNQNHLLYLIEYDGEQHFSKAHSRSTEGFIKQKENDDLKNQYCFKHNIPLIRIPYNSNYTKEDLKLFTSRFILTRENINEYYKFRDN